MGVRLSLLLLLILLSASSIRADNTVITPGSPEGQSIANAANLLEKMGETATAQRVRDRLNALQYSYGHVDGNAETGTSSQYTRIDVGTIWITDLPAYRGITLDPNKNFRELFSLARTLFHEDIHSGQSYLAGLYELSPWEKKHETEAWSKTIAAEASWIHNGYAQHTFTPEQLAIMASNLSSYIGSWGELKFHGLDNSAIAAFQNIAAEMDDFAQRFDKMAVNPPASSPPGGSTPAGGPTTPQPPTPPPPTPPQPPPPPPAPKTPAEVCPECLPYLRAVIELRNELAQAQMQVAAQNASIANNQIAQRAAQVKIAGLQAALAAQQGIGGSGYDPQTGITRESITQADGTVLVTVKDADGNILEQSVRNRSDLAGIQRDLNAAQAQLESLKADAAALVKERDRLVAKEQRLTARLQDGIQQLADCLKEKCSHLIGQRLNTIAEQFGLDPLTGQPVTSKATGNAPTGSTRATSNTDNATGPGTGNGTNKANETKNSTTPMQSGAATAPAKGPTGKGTIPGGGSSAAEPPVPPAPPVPEAPNTSPPNGLPLLPDKPLPECWPAGTDIKAACKAWLDIADRNELAAKLAADALANSQSDLNQADRLDASALQWDAHSQKLSAYSAMYAADAQTYQEKAAAASTDQMAGQWQQMAADATNQSNDIAAQATAATAQANKIRQEAKALRDNVAAEKADLEAKNNAAAASRKAYNDCLALPACPPTENPVSVIGSGNPTDHPNGGPAGNGDNGQNLLNGGNPNSIGGLLGSLLGGSGGFDVLNSLLFGKAPAAPAVQNIVITININPGGAAPATTQGALQGGFQQNTARNQRPASQARGRLRLAAYRFGSPSRAPSYGVPAVPSLSPPFLASLPSAESPTFSIASNGNLGSNALEFRVHDPSGKLKGNISLPEGMVLEPLKPGTPNPVNNAAGGSNVSQQLTAYCLEMAKLPPEVGQLYRLAPPAVQQKYQPIRAVLQAGSKLAAAGKFHPDSDPAAYADFIRQHAVWAQLENWSEQKFAEVFLERTKKNAEHLNVKWTNEMTDALRAAAPGRWRDIAMVLEEAHKSSSTAGAP